MYAIQHASMDSLSKSGFSVVAREGRECGWLLFVGGLDMIMVIIPTPSHSAFLEVLFHISHSFS